MVGGGSERQSLAKKDPQTMKQTKSQRICVRLTDDERASLQDQAKAMNVRESTVIREALSAFCAPALKSVSKENAWSVVDRW